MFQVVPGVVEAPARSKNSVPSRFSVPAEPPIELNRPVPPVPVLANRSTPLPASVSVPAVRLVSPVYSLVPLRIIVPAPALTKPERMLLRLPPASESMLEGLSSSTADTASVPLSTVKVGFGSAIAPPRWKPPNRGTRSSCESIVERPLDVTLERKAKAWKPG